MRRVRDVEHTDADEQRRFMALPADEQMLEIFLNGRETNGHVADVMRDTAELKEWRVTVDRKLVAAAAVLSFILAAGPFVFWALENWR